MRSAEALLFRRIISFKGSPISKNVATFTGASIGGVPAASVEFFEDAIASGASLEDAFKASNLGSIGGLTEGLVIMRILTRVDKSTGGNIRKALTKIIKAGSVKSGTKLLKSEILKSGARIITSGAEEAIQEGGLQIFKRSASMRKQH